MFDTFVLFNEDEKLDVPFMSAGSDDRELLSVIPGNHQSVNGRLPLLKSVENFHSFNKV